MKGLIYKAESKNTGKCYIGQTIQDLNVRKQSHLSDACLFRYNSHFHRALRKYGVDNFKWNIIETIKSDDQEFLIDTLNHREKHFISYFDTFNNGYNSTSGGLNCVFSDEAIKKMIDAHKGKPLSDDHKNKISIALKGRKFSEEHKRKIGEALKGENGYWYGKRGPNYGITGKDNPNSKEFIIITPNGEIFNIKGLQAYCRENDDLKSSHLFGVANGKYKQSKGYRAFTIPGILLNEQRQNTFNRIFN